jgi:zona occludens toxin
MNLATFLISITGTLAARLMTALGIGIFSYAALTTEMNTVISSVQSNFNVIPSQMLNLLLIDWWNRAVYVNSNRRYYSKGFFNSYQANETGMITLITGTPGAGKTVWIVNELLKLRDIEKKSNEYPRTIYQPGIRGLKIDNVHPVYCQSPLCDLCRSLVIEETKDIVLWVEDVNKWAEPGSHVIIDEVQRIWRPRNSANKPPEAVSFLETHRHYGLDFWLISQGPHLFDSFIRLLKGRHVYLLSKWSGSVQYEWPECKQDLSSKGDASIRPYSLPKKTYKLYKSAEVHTKQLHRKPLTFYAFWILLSAGVGMTLYITKRVSDKVHPEKVQQPETKQSVFIQQQAGPVPASTSFQFPDFTPTIKGVPESAPAGCVINRKKNECKCFTKQATPYPSSKVFCESVVNGDRFNPYLDNITQPAQVVNNNTVSDPGDSM